MVDKPKYVPPKFPPIVMGEYIDKDNRLHLVPSYQDDPTLDPEKPQKVYPMDNKHMFFSMCCFKDWGYAPDGRRAIIHTVIH